MLKFGAKVFVVTSEKVFEGAVHGHISHQGVVTGYQISNVNPEDENPNPIRSRKYSKKDVFVDEEEAKKALFKKKLRADKEVTKPAEDMKGDRHWIAGYKKNGYGR